MMPPAPESRVQAASHRRLGAHLLRQRTRLHFSQEALAEALGVSTKSIQRWEQNQALPQPYHREQLCRLLGLDSALFLPELEAELALPPANESTRWYVPFPRNPFFSGREALLEQVHVLLGAQCAATLTQKYALSGLGGIGKTQLALEYAYRHAHDYSAIFWLGAETREALLRDVMTLAAQLELPERAEADQNQLLAALTRWLASQRDWLLILDNLEAPELAQQLLPPTWQGAVLLTTRRPALGALARPIEVDRLPPEEGVQLLLRRAWRLAAGYDSELAEEEVDLARQLVDALDGLPLALDQAGAYLEETQCSLATFLALYQQAPLRLLGERRGNEAHPDSVVRTFALAYERLALGHPGAAALAQVCAYLAPEVIPEELVTEGSAQLGPEMLALVADPFQYQIAFRDLLACGLIRRQAQAGTVSMHRLVQAVLRQHLGEVEQREWAERVVRLVAAAFPAPEFAAWEQCQRLLPHVLVCATHIEHWGFCFSEGAQVLQKAGDFLGMRGQYRAALPLLEQALALREQALPPDHPDVGACLNSLATLYDFQGNYREAVPLYQRALTIREQARSPDHAAVAVTLNKLAVLSWRLGWHRQSVPLLERALALREQALGPDHPDVAASLNSLAALYDTLGQYTVALPLSQRALAIREQALGPDHPDVAANLYILAVLYWHLGQYREALPLYQRAQAIWEQALGPDHRVLSSCLTNLALLYQSQGRYTEALPLAQRALTITQQGQGLEDTGVAEILDTLANLYRAQGQVEQALPLAQRALAIREQILGPEHPDVAASLDTLALLFHTPGQVEQALPLAQRGLSVRERALGHDHPDVAASLITLASLLGAKGLLAEAQPLLERALAIREQMLGAHHPDTAAPLLVLAEAREAQGEPQEAAALYQRALAIYEHVYGSAHPSTTDIRSKLQVVCHTLDTVETVTVREDSPPGPAPTGGEGAAWQR